MTNDQGPPPFKPVPTVGNQARISVRSVQAEMPAQSPRDCGKVMDKTMFGIERLMDATVL